MDLKLRSEPRELRMLKLLKPRMNFSEKENYQLYKLEKGFEGEIYFDKRMEVLSNDWLMIKDLLLEVSDSIVQIDSLFMYAQKIYQFEVKNLEGDYYCEGRKIYSISGTEVKNPLDQMNRNESYLRSLLKDLHVNTPIESYVCFVNPHFQLYNAPQNEPIIFHSQLERFIKKLNSIQYSKMDRQLAVAQKLVSLHKTESPYQRKVIPEYSFESLKKGITCSKCSSYMEKGNAEMLICVGCGLMEHADTAIYRSVDEFNLLFPNEKISTPTIYNWTNGIRSERTIRRILSKRYTLMGEGRGRYFLKK